MSAETDCENTSESFSPDLGSVVCVRDEGVVARVWLRGRTRYLQVFVKDEGGLDLRKCSVLVVGRAPGASEHPEWRATLGGWPKNAFTVAHQAAFLLDCVRFDSGPNTKPLRWLVA